MPYRWQDNPGRARLVAWPHRSLPRHGFVWVIGLMAGFLSLPLLAVTGSPILWGLLPFALLALWGLWFAITRSYRSGQTHEVLLLDTGRLHLTRHDPGRAPREWQANPYWVRAMIRPGPVEDYLVLTGGDEGGRAVELGAFLSPKERRALRDELAARLAALR
ncbi:MAG: DUF2244 domain-containing protein [Paracoccus sp. (in: a-proteobacteria)]|nr:DUF2244 domain-containing protein [Paracoccus sp. (in: a-proteobacteria)]